MRTNIYIKVGLDLDEGDDPARIGEEICRQIRKFYNVQVAEVSNISEDQESRV